MNFKFRGPVQYYTIQRFTPALTGMKECTPTLFPASVTRKLGLKWCGGTERSMPGLGNTGRKECRGTLFPASVMGKQ